VPADLLAAITAITPLIAFIASVLESTVDNVLYLPKGFYYGNPLIPFSGIIPDILDSVAGLTTAVPPLGGDLLNALTSLAGSPAAANAMTPR